MVPSFKTSRMHQLGGASLGICILISSFSFPWALLYNLLHALLESEKIILFAWCGSRQTFISYFRVVPISSIGSRHGAAS